jgi:acyl carrier protein
MQGVTGMMDKKRPDDTIMAILWQSLEGSDHDLEKLKQKLEIDSQFEDFGFDSLEMVDFLLRIEDHFNIAIPQEDYANLVSIAAVQTYISAHQT